MPVRNFPSPEENKRRIAEIEEWNAARRASDIEHGRVAWGNFKEAIRDNLSLDEREIIARNMWKKIEQFKRNFPGSLGALLDDLRIGKNHLDRIALARGKSVGNLMAYPSKYIELMEKLADYSGENKFLMADDVLVGTRFHPKSQADLKEAQLIFDALQVAVDRINQEFNLLEQCQVVAAIREPNEAPYFRALLEKDEAALAAFWESNPQPMHTDPIQLWWPLEDSRLDDYEGNWLAPVNPFWIRPFDGPDAAGVSCREEIFFFPHAYLGAAIQWDRWPSYQDGNQQPELSGPDKAAIRSALRNELEPGVHFDEVKQTYQVYEEPSPGTKRISGDGWDWGTGGYMDNAARWLMIYPDPDAKRLIPALFTRGDMFFTQIEPLSPRLIAELGDGLLWESLSSDGAPTLLQRLRELTGYGTGEFKIMDAWRKTAARFHMNPIFRSHPGEAEKIHFRRHLERWIKDGGVS